LGLASRLTVLHGGSVTVESTLGAGSHFTIALPWLPATPEQAAVTAPSEPELAG